MIKSKRTNYTWYVLIALCVFCAILVIDASHPFSEAARTEESGVMATALMATVTHKAEATSGPIAASAVVVEPKTINLSTPPRQLPEAVARVEPPTPQPEPANMMIAQRPQTITALVTAYCPCARCCGSFANGKTSTGTNAWRPGVAVDPTAIPYGSIVEVPGYGTVNADDTGYAMRHSWDKKGMVQVDIRFQYHWQARQWGRKTLEITVTEPVVHTFTTQN